MFSLANLIASVAKFFSVIVDYFKNQQLIDAGRNEQKVKDVEIALKEKAAADEIKNSVNAADSGIVNELRNKWSTD